MSSPEYDRLRKKQRLQLYGGCVGGQDAHHGKAAGLLAIPRTMLQHPSRVWMGEGLWFARGAVGVSGWVRPWRNTSVVPPRKGGCEMVQLLRGLGRQWSCGGGTVDWGRECGGAMRRWGGVAGRGGGGRRGIGDLNRNGRGALTVCCVPPAQSQMVPELMKSKKALVQKLRTTEVRPSGSISPHPRRVRR